jgi:hypothetical protein
MQMLTGWHQNFKIVAVNLNPESIFLSETGVKLSITSH